MSWFYPYSAFWAVEFSTLTVHIKVKTNLYSAFSWEQKDTLKGSTYRRSFCLSALLILLKKDSYTFSRKFVCGRYTGRWRYYKSWLLLLVALSIWKLIYFSWRNFSLGSLVSMRITLISHSFPCVSHSYHTRFHSYHTRFHSYHTRFHSFPPVSQSSTLLESPSINSVIEKFDWLPLVYHKENDLYHSEKWSLIQRKVIDQLPIISLMMFIIQVIQSDQIFCCMAVGWEFGLLLAQIWRDLAELDKWISRAIISHQM